MYSRPALPHATSATSAIRAANILVDRVRTAFIKLRPPRLDFNSIIVHSGSDRSDDGRVDAVDHLLHLRLRYATRGSECVMPSSTVRARRRALWTSRTTSHRT